MWDEKVGSVERIDGDVFVVVRGTDNPVRVLVSFAPDGAPAGVTFGTPADTAQVLVGRVLRGGRTETPSDMLGIGLEPDRITDAWEALRDRTGKIDEVGDPTVEELDHVTIPVETADASLRVRTELDEVFRVKRIVIDAGTETLMDTDEP